MDLTNINETHHFYNFGRRLFRCMPNDPIECNCKSPGIGFICPRPRRRKITLRYLLLSTYPPPLLGMGGAFDGIRLKMVPPG